MPPLTIEKTDLEPILAVHPGNKAFAAALAEVDSPERLLKMLARYIHFNSTFGAGVASLAGNLGVRQDLFRDPDDPVAITADRSMEVAADVFFAAVDEFDDRATEHRDTHRSLAQSTLKATGTFFGYEAAALARVTSLNPATEEVIAAMRQGYGVGRPLDETALFQALGFHMGSEVLADEEFHHLDDFLRGRYPELVAYLENTTVFINGEHHAAYFWVRIHTSVEADHFAYAVKGANKALRFYAGTRSVSEVKEDILKGIGQFAGVQARFMADIAKDA